jgi:cation diffusion facilitator family transporter
MSFRIAIKPADREHPFGHARIEYVASMIVSFFVLLIGGDLLKESVAKIFSPERPTGSWLSLAVLGASILVKLWIGLFNRNIGKKIDSPVMRATAADSLSDVLSTTAVLIATAIPMFFPSVTLNLDAYMGVVVSVLILIAGAKILNDTKNAILGKAPSDAIIREITAVVESTPGTFGIHDLVVHNYGAGHIIATLHVEVDGKVDIFETHDMIDNIERCLRNDHHIEATIHMDPIVTDDEQINALREQITAVVSAIDERLRIHDFRFVAGNTHTNLIFDIATPFEIKLSDVEICNTVAEKISEIDASYYTVITIDRE